MVIGDIFKSRIVSGLCFLMQEEREMDHSNKIKVQNSLICWHLDKFTEWFL